MYRNNKILKKILGKKQYNELTNDTKKRVIEVFGKQSIIVTKKLIYANNSAVLIIALLKAKKYSDNKSFEKVFVNQLQNNQYLVEKNMDDFIQEYSRYINLIEKKMKSKVKNIR